MTRAANISPEVGGEYKRESWEPTAAPEKPSRDYCKREALRLIGKPFTPSEPSAHGVVIDAIREYSESEAHVKRIVGKLLTDVDRWPDVTDIRAMALETREYDRKPNPGCGKCGGCGYAPAERVVRGTKYYGSQRCDCWRTVRIA